VADLSAGGLAVGGDRPAGHDESMQPRKHAQCGTGVAAARGRRWPLR
jgi:hypothetical protein